MVGNKGEWSEIYTFLKILADGELYSADANLNRIDELFYPVLRIIREEANGELHFLRNSTIKVKNPQNDEILFEIPIDEFISAAELLLGKIRESETSTFEVEEIEEFLQAIDVHSIKSASQNKRDITLVVHDLRTGMTPTLGFSIKSKLGSASTLLNPGRTTNFIYEIIGDPFTDGEILSINQISSRSKVRDRLQRIYDLGRTLEFADMESLNFKLNLQMIDSRMHQIFAEILLLFYGGRANKMGDLIQLLNENNPIEFNTELAHPLYDYKIKSLLTDMALGMTPARVWRGIYDASGGYIVVREDGEVLCYHIYNRNEFQSYLVENTKLETASTSRYEFAEIYEDDGKQFFKLNLQIRFL